MKILFLLPTYVSFIHDFRICKSHVSPKTNGEGDRLVDALRGSVFVDCDRTARLAHYLFSHPSTVLLCLHVLSLCD